MRDGITRHFQRYSSDHRADRVASRRLGHRQRDAVGEYFYTHPAFPGIAFPTRKAAQDAALRKEQL